MQDFLASGRFFVTMDILLKTYKLRLLFAFPLLLDLRNHERMFYGSMGSFLCDALLLQCYSFGCIAVSYNRLLEDSLNQVQAAVYLPYTNCRW